MTQPGVNYGLAPNDWCMVVGVMADGQSANGFNQNGNGNDAPTSDTDWPNSAYTQPSHVSIWIK